MLRQVTVSSQRPPEAPGIATVSQSQDTGHNVVCHEIGNRVKDWCYGILTYAELPGVVEGKYDRTGTGRQSYLAETRYEGRSVPDS